MRFLPFIVLLLTPGIVFGQACTEATINTSNGTNTYNCTTLIVSGGGIIRSGDNSSNPLIINVSGDVLISSNILLNGANGSTDAGIFDSGAGGGPDGSFGGGGNGAETEPGAGPSKADPDGGTASQELPCARGGGGAGFAVNGNDGKSCSTSTSPGNRGVQSTVEFDFGTFFRGGFGGGAGGLGNSVTFGGGGGGGGALKIIANGSITIDAGVTISSRGGNGGNNTTDGGGGGAGSGGAVWLISSTAINNKGTIDLRGGTGGLNNATGAHGGNGSSGRYRIEVAGIVSEGTGLTNFGSSTSNLNSSISCGSIQKNPKNTSNEIFMILVGFLSALLLLPKKSFSRNK